MAYRASAVRCVYSDASDVGYGGHIVEHGMHLGQGIWSSEEAELYLERACSSGVGATISCGQTW